MELGDTPLIIAHPDDTVSALVERIQQTGAKRIQLLIPEGATQFQNLVGFAELRLTASKNQIAITIISPDEQTIALARKLRFDTLSVRPAQPSAPHTTATPPPATSPATTSEGAMLEAMEQMPASIDDDDLENAPTAVYDIYADDLPSAYPATASPPASTPVDETAYYTPETESWDAQGETLPVPARRRNTEEAPRLASSRDATPLARSSRTSASQRERDAYAYETEEESRKSVPLLIPLLVMGLILAAVIGVGWYLSNRVTIQISPPPGVSRVITFTNEPIPIVAQEPAGTGTIVAAAASATVETTVQGQASQQRTPVGVARGSVRIINSSPQAFELPQGTEFVATNSQGQEVRFLSDGTVTVPPSVTSTSLTGSQTTFGQIDVAISARSPGSASNVDANTITQIIPPNQSALPIGSGIQITHDAIGGGTEEDLFIVSQEDVTKLLPDALKQLYELAQPQLAGQVTEGEVDLSTLSPNLETIGNAGAYEIVSVTPAIGQQAPADNPVFSVLLRSTFTALVTPKDQSVSEQLETKLSEHLTPNGTSPCADGEDLSYGDTSYNWDGSRLAVSGSYMCTPRGAIANETIEAVKTAVRSQTYEAALYSLQQLQEQGKIGNFVIPQRERFPSFGFLLNVEQRAVSTSSGTMASPTSAIPETTVNPAEAGP